MRKALIVFATVALSGSGQVSAMIGPPPPACPLSPGMSKAPFYFVRASANVMPGVGRQRSVAVSGRYYLGRRRGAVRLVRVEPQGINPRILMLRVERVANPAAFGSCPPFNGHYPFPGPVKIFIKDWAGKSITVPVKTFQ